MAAEPNDAGPSTSALLPDLDCVRHFIVKMLAQGALPAVLAYVMDLLGRMRELNLELTRRLMQANRKRPPSERMRRLQLELPFLSQPPQNDAASAQDPDARLRTTSAGKKKRGPRTRHAHGRPKFPDHLPRVSSVQRVPEAQRICPCCNVEATPLGRGHVVQKLDIEPARFVVREEIQEVLACSKCHQYVVRADKGDEVVDRGVLGNELLVQATVDHYQDAVPWERMERNARQQGAPLSANTLAHSCGRLLDLFEPIVQHIFDKCLSSSYVALDATGIPVLDDGVAVGIRTGSLWLLQGDHRYSYFFYASSGHAAHLEEKLAGYRLERAMCDGSPTNNVVERAGALRGGCNAHARRMLVEALRCGDQRALKGLELYGALFHVEAESKRAGETIDKRLSRRCEQSAPLAAELKSWVDSRMKDVEPKSKLGRAIRYLHRQWPRLTRFLNDAHMDLTNNEVERDLRTWVLDRKTWLFCGHDDSARRAASALTIITTCKKLGIEPRAYIRDTLRKLLDGDKSLAALLPENYKPDRMETRDPSADGTARAA